jgi:hypothetical protein
MRRRLQRVQEICVKLSEISIRVRPRARRFTRGSLTSQLQEAREAFRTPACRAELDDTGFDIGPYLEASCRPSYRYLPFLNSYTIAASGGLNICCHACGGCITGAMGSYESLFVHSIDSVDNLDVQLFLPL